MTPEIFVSLPIKTRRAYRGRIRSASLNSTVINRVLRSVEKETGVGRGEIMSKLRLRKYVDARRYYAEMMYRHSKLTLTGIGEVIDKSHCMIIHYRKTLGSLLEYDEEIKDTYERIEKRMLYDN